MTTDHRCRACNARLTVVAAELGYSPLANGYQREPGPQTFFPLTVYVCGSCFLVQLPAWADPDKIFAQGYAYFSSTNPASVESARVYAETMIRRCDLTHESRVVEVASNDGYLLQHFQAKGIHVLGVEPAGTVASYARERRIPTVSYFFGTAFATEYKVQADLLVANNVLAHVPDLNDFVEGLRLALKPDGLLTVEVPWLLRMLEAGTFDLIYHEHYSYFSLGTLNEVFLGHGLMIEDVEELPTHGGSLRLFIRHREVADRTGRVIDMLLQERAAGLTQLATYTAFAERIRVRRQGGNLVYFGAPAKLTTRLHALGEVGQVRFVVDDTPAKQGTFLPGTVIPIYPVSRIMEDPPEVVVVAAWNVLAACEKRLRDMGYEGEIRCAA